MAGDHSRILKLEQHDFGANKSPERVGAHQGLLARSDWTEKVVEVLFHWSTGHSRYLMVAWHVNIESVLSFVAIAANAWHEIQNGGAVWSKCVIGGETKALKFHEHPMTA